MDQSFRNRFNKDFEDYLLRYDSPKYPPWMKRKRAGMFQCMAHPDFDADFSVIMRCSPASVREYYGELLFYFVNTYQINPEVIETWVRFAITGKMDLMDDSTQLAPTLLYDDKEKVAWPSDNPKKEYELMQSDPFRQDGYVNIRIGRSSTKKDVKWMIDDVWDSEIEPRLMQLKLKKEKRIKPLYLRNSTIYSLKRHGKSDKYIAEYINEHFPFPTPKDPSKQKIMDEFYVRKLINDFVPPKEDWFATIHKIIRMYDQRKLSSRTLRLGLSDDPKKEFTIS